MAAGYEVAHGVRSLLASQQWAVAMAPLPDLATLSMLVAAGTGLLSLISSFVTRRFVEPNKDEIKRAEALARAAWHQIDTIDLPGHEPISTPISEGDKEALKILAQYAADLRSEASRIAKRVSAERPSPSHVKLAADRLGIIRHSASAMADIGLSLGALLVGGAAAFTINLATGGHAAESLAGWAIGVGVAGIVLFSVSATTKWIKR